MGQVDLLEIDRDDSVSTETQKHRLELFSTIKRSKSLQNAKQNLINTTKISRTSGYYWNFLTIYRNWKTKLIVWMILSIFIMLNRYALEFPRYQPTSFIPISSNSWRNTKPFFRSAEPQRRTAHMVNRETFLQFHLHLHQHLILKNCISGIHRSRSRSIRPQWRKWKTRTKSRSEMPVWTVSQRFSHLQWRRLFKELVSRPTTIADFGSSFRQIPYTSHVWLLAEKNQDWGMWLFTISYGSYAMDQRSGDGRFSGQMKIFVIKKSSKRGISMPNFEVLDARIASALNKIIHNSHFKRKISLEEQKAQKEDCFLRGRQIAYLIYDYFRVTGVQDSVENYTDLFTFVLRNDDIREFDSKWDGILLSMTKIPPDDILEGLYKLRIRESEKLKTVLELYDLETHQKKLGPDYYRLKTMVKRSIEQQIRNKNFGPEAEIMRRTSWSRTRE